MTHTVGDIAGMGIVRYSPLKLTGEQNQFPRVRAKVIDLIDLSHLEWNKSVCRVKPFQISVHPAFKGIHLKAGHMIDSQLYKVTRQLTRYALAFLTAISCIIGMPLSQSLAQGVVKAKYGDWQLRCETPPGAAHEQCALLQSVAAEDKPNINLVVIVLKTADGKNRLLRVIAPLGILLPSGLGLKVDDTDIGRAGFVRCLPSGCVAEVVMEEKLIDQLKNGKNATFIIFQTPEEGVGIPLALAGFKEGFNALP